MNVFSVLLNSPTAQCNTCKNEKKNKHAVKKVLITGENSKGIMTRKIFNF